MKLFSEFESSLLEILDAAIKMDGAVKGNVQLVNPVRDGLQIAVQRGFDQSFLQLFELVRADEPSACGRAFRSKQRVMIPDIMEDVFFGPYLSAASNAGYRAVQSTPIIAADGSVKGVFSTHYPGAHKLSPEVKMALDDCASKMAELIDGHFANRSRMDLR
jgi:GAF domain-containing protein